MSYLRNVRQTLFANTESLPQQVAPSWCPKTHAYYRRVSLRSKKMNLAHALEETAEYPIAHNFYQERVQQAQAQEPTTFPEILAGNYLPDMAAVSANGMIIQENNQPDRITHSEHYCLASSKDVTQHETPALDQAVPVDAELVAELSMHAMFRERNTDLLLSIKAKGTQLLRSYRNSSGWKAHQLAMATALAFVPSEQEKLALTHLRSPIPSANWLWVNDILCGGDSTLRDHAAKRPKLVTRFLDWISPNDDKLRKLSVK